MFKKDLLKFIDSKLTETSTLGFNSDYEKGFSFAMESLKEYIKKTPQRKTFTETKIQKLIKILKKEPEKTSEDLSNALYNCYDKSSMDSLRVLISQARKVVRKEGLEIFVTTGIVTLVNKTPKGFQIYGKNKPFILRNNKCLPGYTVSRFWS
jgi:hypothetical protein